jgi:hypothetical protein
VGPFVGRIPSILMCSKLSVLLNRSHHPGRLLSNISPPMLAPISN